jgi:hypothetical protein
MNNDAGGGPPILDAPQAAVAEDAGVTIAARRAAFSGTATFVELEASVNQAAGSVVAVQIPSSAFAQRSIAPAAGQVSVSLAAGRASTARLSPANPGSESFIEFTRVTLVRADGSSQDIDGRWRLPIATPADLAARLRLERLNGEGVADAGMRVSVEGAVRSTTETLVTVRFDAAEPLQQLGVPVATASGRSITGGLVSSQEGGRLVTYAFPATPFGSELVIRFGPFTRALPNGSWSARVDLGAILARNALSGRNRESASVSPADVEVLSGAPATFRSISFSDQVNNSLRPDEHNAVTFVLEGVLAPWAGARPVIAAVGAGGKTLDPGSVGAGYSKDPAGVLSSPRTEISFMYSDLADLKGPVIISYEGSPEGLVRGNWSLRLTPAR